MAEIIGLKYSLIRLTSHIGCWFIMSPAEFEVSVTGSARASSKKSASRFQGVLANVQASRHRLPHNRQPAALPSLDY